MFTLSLNSKNNSTRGLTGIIFPNELAGRHDVIFDLIFDQEINITFEFFSNTQLISSVTVSQDSTLTKVAKIAYLDINEALQVKTTTGVLLYDANLTAARLG